MRRILRTARVSVLAAITVYIGDDLSVRIPVPRGRQVFGSVQVETLYAVRLKNGKIEYSRGEAEIETCVRSIFPHLGYSPCWRLRRNPTRRIEIGATGPSGGWRIAEVAR